MTVNSIYDFLINLEPFFISLCIIINQYQQSRALKKPVSLNCLIIFLLRQADWYFLFPKCIPQGNRATPVVITGFL